MTRELERAIAEVEKLPGPEQDAITAMILAQLADDRAWDEVFARSQDSLARLAQQAREEIAAGRVRPLRPRRP
ncbi:MAG TPA: hypothetical protein VG406_03995 [Isosphaeraceae bacterium]|jgi:hypothetical protein|nr:hypothetical protein [Isosphaeraceae bacterium]